MFSISLVSRGLGELFILCMQFLGVLDEVVLRSTFLRIAVGISNLHPYNMRSFSMDNSQCTCQYHLKLSGSWFLWSGNPCRMTFFNCWYVLSLSAWSCNSCIHAMPLVSSLVNLLMSAVVSPGRLSSSFSAREISLLWLPYREVECHELILGPLQSGVVYLVCCEGVVICDDLEVLQACNCEELFAFI